MRILIADDHALFRDGLRSLLGTQGHEVIAEARNGREAIDLTKKLTPDLVLMDISMPRMDGVASTRIIHREVPEARIVIVSQNDPAIVRRQAAEAGAGCAAGFKRAYILGVNRVRPKRFRPSAKSLLA